jgi:carboxyl-terminal processing protease
VLDTGENRVSDFSIEERSWMLGKLYLQIAEYFAHWEDASFSRDQLDDVYRACLQEGLAATNRHNFVEVMRRWVGRLNNGHSWCYDSQFKAGSQLGFQMERMEEGWVVIRSLVNEVAKGDVIEFIDGYTPEEWMEKAKPYITVKQSKAREAQWQYIMPTIWNVHEAKLRVRTRNDKVRDIVYRPIRLDTEDPRLNGQHREQEHTEGHWIKEGLVGYIRIPSFSKPHYAEEAISYVRQFANAETIILDIRSNGGGSTPSSLINALMDRPYRWWTETSPNIGHLRKRHVGGRHFTIFPDGTGARWESDWIEPSGCLFTGRVIALTGRYTGSAAEDFIMPFKDTGRGTLVGESTWGSTGQPMFFDYRDVHVGIGSVRAYMPDGTPFEGVGIAPDITVWRTRDDLYAGRDPVLEKALDLLE